MSMITFSTHQTIFPLTPALLIDCGNNDRISNPPSILHCSIYNDSPEGDHDTVEDGLEGGNPVDHLEGPEDSQQLHGLQLGTCRSPPGNNKTCNTRDMNKTRGT